VGLRAAGLGSVKGVILGREKGVALGCDLTPSFAQITPFEPASELAPPNAAGIQTWFMVFAQGKEGPIEFNESHVCSPREHKFMRKEVVPARGLGSAPGTRIEGVKGLRIPRRTLKAKGELFNDWL